MFSEKPAQRQNPSTSNALSWENPNTYVANACSHCFLRAWDASECPPLLMTVIKKAIRSGCRGKGSCGGRQGCQKAEGLTDCFLGTCNSVTQRSISENTRYVLKLVCDSHSPWLWLGHSIMTMKWDHASPSHTLCEEVIWHEKEGNGNPEPAYGSR